MGIYITNVTRKEYEIMEKITYVRKLRISAMELTNMQADGEEYCYRRVAKELIDDMTLNHIKKLFNLQKELSKKDVYILFHGKIEI